MTAPDPGLTDLIAAHYTWREVDEGGDYLVCACGHYFASRQTWAEHLKLAVEQHTNGRIAGTVKSTGQRMYAQTKKWQERAEKAEAERSQIKDALWTIMSQLDSQAEYLGTGDDGTEWINYARNKIQKAYVECGLHLELDAGRAALEG